MSDREDLAERLLDLVIKAREDTRERASDDVVEAILAEIERTHVLVERRRLERKDTLRDGVWSRVTCFDGDEID